LNFNHCNPKINNQQQCDTYYTTNNSSDDNELMNENEDELKELLEQIILKIYYFVQSITKDHFIVSQLNLIEKRMETDEKQFDSDEQNLLNRKNELIEWIEKNEGKEMDVDTMINPQDVHSQQILELSSEEMAIDDAIYYLEQKLETGGIELNDWFKHIRELSRKQFLKKALIKKMSQMN
jgi:ESCRT-I complex subunit TSG101